MDGFGWDVRYRYLYVIDVQVRVDFHARKSIE